MGDSTRTLSMISQGPNNRLRPNPLSLNQVGCAPIPGTPLKGPGDCFTLAQLVAQ